MEARAPQVRSPRGKPAEPRPTDGAHKVHVTGYPPYTQAIDLARTFAKFGTVRVETHNPRSFAVLQYTSEQEARAAIQANGKVNIYGEFLSVRARTNRDNKAQLPRRDFTRTKLKEIILEPKEIDLSGDFHNQVDAILAAVRLTQEQATAVSTLYADLERVLQPLWPGCVAMPFGSITTGLGIKSSDADCFVSVPAMFQPQQHTFVNKAKRVLETFPQIFAEILSIPRANTPIVKFFHIPTETNCDLSFKTPLGAQNSKLIAFLLHADPRLIPMAVVIKYWAKVHGLSGTGRLTNYALTMMIIFYLQQPPMSILPSVEWLQRDSKYDCIVDFWNTGFMNSKELLPPCSNTSSISELLGGFFEFYSTYNFEAMVVSPYLGVSVKKEAFVDITKIPREYDRYKANVLTKLTPGLRATTAICVQDPFEQCHNVASAITSKLASDIKAYLKFAADSYEKEKLNGCKDFLKTILLQKPKLIRAKSHPEFRICLFPKTLAGIVNPDWRSVVRGLVLKIFQDCLKIKLERVDQKADEKVKDKAKEKTNDIVNPEQKKQKERYMATITKAIWKRKQFSRLYSVMKLGFAAKQARITEEIMAVEKTLLNLEIQLSLHFRIDLKTAAVLVKFIDGDIDAFNEFYKFLVSILQHWFSNMLIPFMKSSAEMPAKIEETISMINTTDGVDGNGLDSDDDSEENIDNGEAETADNDEEGLDNGIQSTDEETGVADDTGNKAKGDANCIRESTKDDKDGVANHIGKDTAEVQKDIKTDKGSDPAKPDSQSNSYYQ